MKIGIIGSGNMGRSLGIAWTELGHDVFFGGRDPEQVRQAAALTHGKARSGTNDEAFLVKCYSTRFAGLTHLRLCNGLIPWTTRS
jgi:predicted dinucleotide-binding enzyme